MIFLKLVFCKFGILVVRTFVFLKISSKGVHNAQGVSQIFIDNLTDHQLKYSAFLDQ